VLAVVAAAAPLFALPAGAAAHHPIRDVAVDGPGGEPEIAVNPRNPRQVVVGENVNGVAFSGDGGATWKHVSLPNIGDNVLAVEPDGTFLFSSINGTVWASRDGGANWTKSGNWVGKVAEAMYAAAPDLGYPTNVAAGDVIRQSACDVLNVSKAGPAGTGPDDPGIQVLGCDRPWLITDPNTGRAYLSFSAHNDASGGPRPSATNATTPWEVRFAACRANNGSSPFQCGRQYVAASGDDGRTWTTFRPMDSADYPAAGTNGWSGGPVASFGTLATAYVATSTRCRNLCLVFETSHDDGARWTRHVIGAVNLPSSSGGLSTTFNFEPYIAADPTRRGRYAVLVLDTSQQHLLVYVTDDGGKRWHRTALAERGSGVNRWVPWIAYGPSGALGVVWRTAYADGTFDVWAAVAPRGDGNFGRPVRLSSARSPGPVAPGGDDASDVVLTRTTLYAAWGDQRGTPPPAGWFGTATDHVGSYRFVG
jgi:hypothetical protein